MWAFFSRDAAKDFAYEISTEVEGVNDYSVWRLHQGKKKSSGEAVSIFVFESSNAESQTLFDIAKSALKRAKTLRHPSIITYVDSLETDKLIYLVVEPVEPLELHLSKISKTEQKQFALSWGLYQIATGLTFLNKDCQLSHYNVCMPSVFVDRAGEWKLFGLEYLTPSKDPPPIKVLPSLQIYNPPEHESSKHDDNPLWAYDSWGLGCLIWEASNGRLTKISSLKSPGKIPSNLAPLYCELVCANPKSRPSSVTFLKKASKGTGFFKNKFVESMLFLREIHIKENDEKLKFFNNLSSSLDTFPQEICLYRVLPELINAFEFGNAGSSVLSPMFKLGKLLSEDEYQKKIVPCIVKMFSSKDRATRVKLLQQIEEFIDHIQPSIVNNQIFPNVAQGFMDTNPTIRDHTIKCMIYLAPKLNYQNLNEEMLKHFARLQSKDDQGGIRTNTTVCLGKISSYLHPQTRKKVLISAFLRALRDPFPPARTAAILALSATEHYYSINDCATKVLPALCHFTVDPEKSIRDQAFKAIKGFLSKLEKVSEDPSLIEKMEAELQSTMPSSIAASWTSWAVTSIADKLYKSKSQNQNSSERASKSPSPEMNAKTVCKTPDETSDDKEFGQMNSWDSSDWRDDEVSMVKNEMTSQPTLANEETGDSNDWDDDWQSLEIDPNFVENSQKLKNFFPAESDDPFNSIQSNPIPKSKSTSDVNDWNASDNWDSWEKSDSKKNTEAEQESQLQKQEARRIRDERRQQRLKERHQAKPKKLGAQKLS